MIKIDIENVNGKYTMENLLYIMRCLRAPDGCPWDKEQTHSSIRNNFLEETYEVLDAIDRNDSTDMCEELGDVLMQVVFHSVISAESNEFDFSDVVDGVCKKLVYRHPHVFGNVEADTTEKVLENWDALKRIEKAQETYTDTLRSVPSAFPALLRASKVQKRACKAGCNFETVDIAIKNINQKTENLQQFKDSQDKSLLTEQIGDLLFCVVNAARLLGVDGEEALGKSTQKFINNFENSENQAMKDGFKLNELSKEQLEGYFKNS